MLRVMFGEELPECITCVSTYFNNVYEMSWFDDEIVKSIVRDIDKSELNGACVLSPFLGSISVEKLSGGAKGLILMYKLDDFKSDLISYGNNCEDWIIRLSSMKDIDVCMTGYDMTFDAKNIEAFCLNDDSLIHGSAEWCRKMVEFGGSIYYEG